MTLGSTFAEALATFAACNALAGVHTHVAARSRRGRDDHGPSKRGSYSRPVMLGGECGGRVDGKVRVVVVSERGADEAERGRVAGW